MSETWKRTAPNRHPEGVAQEFVDELFPGREAARTPSPFPTERTFE